MLDKIIKRSLLLLVILNLIISVSFFALSVNEKANVYFSQKFYSTLKHDPNPDNFYKDPLRIAKWTGFTKNISVHIYKTAFIFTIIISGLLFFRKTILSDIKNCNFNLNFNPAKLLDYRFIIIFILSALFLAVKLNSPLEPVFTTDGYQDMAFKFFDGMGLTHNKDRNFIYPLFILVTAIGGNFKTVTVVQHILGIITSILIYLTIIKFNKINRTDSKILKAAVTITAFSAFILYNLSSTPFYLEKHFYREGFTPVLYAFLAYMLVSFGISFVRNEKILLKAGIIIFMNYMIFSVQSRWGFNLILIPAVVYTIIFIKYKTDLSSRILYSVFIPFTLCFTLLYVPEKTLALTDTTPKVFGPLNFLFSNMNVISPVMQHDIENPDFNKYDKTLLKDLIDDLDNAETDSMKYHAIGYDFNKLMWGESKKRLLAHFNGDTKKVKGFCYNYYIRSAAAYPHLLFKKISDSLSDYYSPATQRIGHRNVIKYNNIYRNITNLDISFKSSNSPVLKKYFKNIHELSLTAGEIRYANVISGIFAIVNNMFYPIILINLFLIAAIFIKKRNISLLTITFITGLLIVFLSNLTSAISYILIERYLDDLMSITLLTTAAGVLNIVFLPAEWFKGNLE